MRCMLCFVVLLVLCLASAAMADEVQVSTGVYAEKDYTAGYLQVDSGDFHWYWEHEPGLDFDLNLFTYRQDNWGIVLRTDEGKNFDWLRVGGLVNLGGGKSTFCLRMIDGADAPRRWDIFGPPIRIAGNVTLDTWIMDQEGKPCNLRLGPTWNCGRLNVWYRYNFESEGSWAGGFGFKVADF